MINKPGINRNLIFEQIIRNENIPQKSGLELESSRYPLGGKPTPPLLFYIGNSNYK